MTTPRRRRSLSARRRGSTTDARQSRANPYEGSFEGFLDDVEARPARAGHRGPSTGTGSPPSSSATTAPAGCPTPSPPCERLALAPQRVVAVDTGSTDASRELLAAELGRGQRPDRAGRHRVRRRGRARGRRAAGRARACPARRPATARSSSGSGCCTTTARPSPRRLRRLLAGRRREPVDRGGRSQGARLARLVAAARGRDHHRRRRPPRDRAGPRRARPGPARRAPRRARRRVGRDAGPPRRVGRSSAASTPACRCSATTSTSAGGPTSPATAWWSCRRRCCTTSRRPGTGAASSPARFGSVHRADRRSAVRVLLANCPAYAVPWHWLRLLVGTLLRTLGLLLGKAPTRGLGGGDRGRPGAARRRSGWRGPAAPGARCGWCPAARGAAPAAAAGPPGCGTGSTRSAACCPDGSTCPRRRAARWSPGRPARTPRSMVAAPSRVRAPLRRPGVQLVLVLLLLSLVDLPRPAVRRRGGCRAARCCRRRTGPATCGTRYAAGLARRRRRQLDRLAGVPGAGGGAGDAAARQGLARGRPAAAAGRAAGRARGVPAAGRLSPAHRAVRVVGGGVVRPAARGHRRRRVRSAGHRGRRVGAAARRCGPAGVRWAVGGPSPGGRAWVAGLLLAVVVAFVPLAWVLALLAGVGTVLLWRPAPCAGGCARLAAAGDAGRPAAACCCRGPGTCCTTRRRCCWRRGRPRPALADRHLPAWHVAVANPGGPGVPSGLGHGARWCWSRSPLCCAPTAAARPRRRGWSPPPGWSSVAGQRRSGRWCPASLGTPVPLWPGTATLARRRRPGGRRRHRRRRLAGTAARPPLRLAAAGRRGGRAGRARGAGGPRAELAGARGERRAGHGRPGRDPAVRAGRLARCRPAARAGPAGSRASWSRTAWCPARAAGSATPRSRPR